MGIRLQAGIVGFVFGVVAAITLSPSQSQCVRWTQKLERAFLNGKPYWIVPDVQRINHEQGNFNYGVCTAQAGGTCDSQQADDIKELAWRIYAIEEKLKIKR